MEHRSSLCCLFHHKFLSRSTRTLRADSDQHPPPLSHRSAKKTIIYRRELRKPAGRQATVKCVRDKDPTVLSYTRKPVQTTKSANKSDRSINSSASIVARTEIRGLGKQRDAHLTSLGHCHIVIIHDVGVAERHTRSSPKFLGHWVGGPRKHAPKTDTHTSTKNLAADMLARMITWYISDHDIDQLWTDRRTVEPN